MKKPIKINNDDADFDDVVAVISKKLSENYQMNLITLFNSLNLTDHNGKIQGAVCHMVSAFILSYTIKILRMNNMSSDTIKKVCDNCIDIAQEFSYNADYKEIDLSAASKEVN